MRGRLSDQDLTDYALNELAPEERLYVESILAVSEECRSDVYEMIELGQMLEETFEADDEKASVCLRPEQRSTLIDFRRRPPAWQKAAAVLGAAACAAFALTYPTFWQMDNAVATVANAAKAAKASSQVSDIAQAVVPETVDFSESLSNLRAIADDSVSWIDAEVLAPAPLICTPPSSWVEAAQLSSNTTQELVP